MTKLVWQKIASRDVRNDDYYEPQNVTLPQSCLLLMDWGINYERNMQRLTLSMKKYLYGVKYDVTYKTVTLDIMKTIADLCEAGVIENKNFYCLTS